MQIAQREIRIIWLMLLMITGSVTWFLDVRMLSYLCLLALIVSVMYYVGAMQKLGHDIAQQQQLRLFQQSRSVLYVAALVVASGVFVEKYWMIAIGLTGWIYFFLRWLTCLEQNLIALQAQQQQHSVKRPQTQQSQAISETASSKQVPIQAQPSVNTTHEQAKQSDVVASALEHIVTPAKIDTAPALEPKKTIPPLAHTTINTHARTTASHVQANDQMTLLQQLQHWIFKGNPVLKAAIAVLLIGIVLLLRFATEHWQLDLAAQLSAVSTVCIVISALGYHLYNKNRAFSLGLEGLGIAGLCLCLFFAYYNQIIASLLVASLLFIVLMLVTIRLSLKQKSIELALMAMLIAYIAPFTLPVRVISSVELLAYYWVINLAVAVLSSLRPWKILTQVTFLLTVLIATGYGLLHPDAAQFHLLILILAHSVLFIWLGFRYSQLLAKQDLQQFKLNPILDLVLIFGVPLVAYGLIYLIYFQQRFWQAALSLVFVVIYAMLYQLAKRNQAISVISQSYLSLMLIFLAFIPPILLEGYWSAMGWAVEALLIFIFALQRQSKVARYLAMALSMVAGLSGIYYVFAEQSVPLRLYWCLSLVGIGMVLVAHARESYRKQYDLPMLLQHVFQMFSSMCVLLWLISDIQTFEGREATIVFGITLMLFAINEWMYRAHATWTWWIVRCAVIVAIWLYAFNYLFTDIVFAEIVWPSLLQRGLFILAGLLLTFIILRTRVALLETREISSFAVLLSLGLASFALLSNMAYVSVIIFPMLFAIWSYKQSKLQLIWQSYSALYLMVLWILCSQLFSKSIFTAYYLPLINPFDAASLVMLVCFLWMLTLQLKRQVDRGLIAIMAVLGVLWLSSYILLRALHVYLATPYSQLQLWQDATVQFSLTLLWVSLAFIAMTIATKKSIRALWLLGASLLVIVTLKLVLIDLSHIGTLLRVGSFLVAGFIMLVIAYIAPMPEAEKSS